jgi:hypothetical protein
MSSSGERPDWSVFTERETLPDPGMLSPAAEMAAALQQCRAAIEAAEQGAVKERARWLDVLAAQAVLIVRLEEALSFFEEELTEAGLARPHRHLRVLKDQMLDTLRHGGLEMVIPAGRPFDEVVDEVHVDGWLHEASFTAEVVARVVEPIVRADGVLVRMGRVVMGAPPAPVSDDSEPASAPEAVEEQRRDEGCKS